MSTPKSGPKDFAGGDDDGDDDDDDDDDDDGDDGADDDDDGDDDDNDKHENFLSGFLTSCPGPNRAQKISHKSHILSILLTPIM